MIRILVICNPFAGGGTAQSVGEHYEQFAQENSNYHFQFYYTTKPNDSKAIAHAIKACKPSIISIVGGDGTINEVLNVVESHAAAIHLVPAGSGNDFHRLVYGAVSVQDSIKSVLHDKRAQYDFGMCNDRYFLNGVGVGFDGSVARETMRMRLPFISSKWKYWIAIFKNVLFYKSVNVEIHFDTTKLTRKMFMIAIANGTDYGGGFKISPESNAQDGKLNVVMIDALNPLKRLINIPKVESGRHLPLSFVHQKLAQKVSVSADKILHAHLDGEQMSSMRFDIEIKPPLTFVV